jgi:Predicted outer membrane protein
MFRKETQAASQPKRWLAMLLAFLTIISLIPSPAFAAGDAPATAKLTQVDGNPPSYTSGNGLGTVYIQPFTMEVSGQSVTAFCFDHAKHIGPSAIGNTWNLDTSKSVSPLALPFLDWYYAYERESLKMESDNPSLSEAELSIKYGPAYWSAWTRRLAGNLPRVAVWLSNSGSLTDLSSSSQRDMLAMEYSTAYSAAGGSMTLTMARTIIDAAISDWNSGSIVKNNYYIYQHSSNSSYYQPILVPVIESYNYYSAHLKLRKTNGTAPLAGCIFEVFEDAACRISLGQIDTTSSEWSISGNINIATPTATLYVKEVYAPSGYTIDDTVYPVTVDSTQNGTAATAKAVNNGIPIVNGTTVVRDGQFKIIKLSAGTTKGLAGAVFDVYFNAAKIGSYATDSSGVIVVDGIRAGTWTIVERVPPANHLLSANHTQTITITQKDIDDEIPITVTFENAPFGSLLVEKRSTPSNSKVKDAVFLVREVATGYEFTMTTDSSGTAFQDRLPLGAYEIRELSMPMHIVLDVTPQTVSVISGKTSSVLFTNKEKAMLEILKTSAKDHSPIAGVIFIVKEADGKTVSTVITGADGKARVPDLIPGKVYSVSEQSVPEPWILDTTPQLVTMEEGKTIVLSFKNEVKPTLEIIKTSKKDNTPIGGVSFLIKEADGKTITTVVTGADGKATVPNLMPGVVYSVQEQSVPEPWILDTTPQLVTLEAGKTATLRFQNERKPNLLIVKQDSITGDRIPQTKFQLFMYDAEGGKTDLGIFYTDEHGEIKLENLPECRIEVIEVEPVHGYAIKGDGTQEVYLKGDEDKTLTFENVPLSALIIRKIDNDTRLPVAGAAFRIRYLGGTSGSGGTIIHEGVTSHNGTIVLTGLAAGTYVCEEYRPSEGYELSNPSVQTAYLSGRDQDIITLEFSNAKQGELVIQKLDSITKQPLKGAIFEITDSSGAVIGANNGTYTTDASGMIFVSEYLPIGSTVVVREVSAPSGYTLDGTAQTVKIKENTTHKLTFLNTPTGGLQILKLDEQSRRPIAGVEFAVARMNGERIGTYTTDKNGQIFIPNIGSGWFTATEIKAAKGYLLDSIPHNIEVQDGKTAVLTITNKMVSGIFIRKIDSVTKQGIAGVTFLLYDSRKNPVGQYVSTQDGYVFIDEGLPEGRYYMRELKAEGYIVDETLKTIDIRYGSTVEIIWENTPIRGQIQVIKRSADDNPTNGLPAGTLLVGAVFEIYDKAGNLVDTIVTGRDGRAVSRLLPLSRYTIREAKAPAYYSVNDTVMTAYLEHEGQIVTFEVLNKSVNTGVNISKTGYAEVMSNQPIKYMFSGIANTSSVPLNSFYWRDTLPAQVQLTQVVTGTYNQTLSYKIVYKTNLSADYLTLADNLSTGRNYALDASPAALGLAANERVTEVMFVFGTVRAGFAQVETPFIHGQTISSLVGGSEFVNVADVGGQHNGQWVMGVSRWVTNVYGVTTTPSLPKTGY